MPLRRRRLQPNPARLRSSNESRALCNWGQVHPAARGRRAYYSAKAESHSRKTTSGLAALAANTDGTKDLPAARRIDRFSRGSTEKFRLARRLRSSKTRDQVEMPRTVNASCRRYKASLSCRRIFVPKPCQDRRLQHDPTLVSAHRGRNALRRPRTSGRRAFAKCFAPAPSRAI